MFYFTRKLIYLVLAVLICSYAKAQTPVIEVYGNIGDENTDLSGVTIQVLQGGRVYSSTKTDPNGNYGFSVSLGGEFMVEVIQPGYVTKKFTISTLGVPKDDPAAKFKPIGASINLFKKVEGIDYSVMNQPLMKFQYNRDAETMEFDKTHQAMMAEELRKIEEAEKELLKSQRDKEVRYASLVKDGDKALSKKDYASAITNYSEALKLKPKEIYPASQIELTKRTQSEAEAIAKQDADAKRKADADALAKKQADDAAAKTKAAADLAAKAQAEKDLAAKLAKEKADADAKAKADADAKSKLAADALAKKQADDAAENAKAKADADAKAKLAADALAKKQADDVAAKAKADAELAKKAEADKVLADKLAKEKADAELASKAKAEKELADKLAKEKADADLKSKIAADELAKKQAAEQAEKARVEAITAKAKAEQDALAKEKAAEAERQRLAADAKLKEQAELEKIAKEKLAAENKLKAEKEAADKLVADKLAAETKAKQEKLDAEKKKAQDELLAKLKTEKELADKKAADKAAEDARLLADAKKKDQEASLAKKKLEDEERAKNERLIAEANARDKLTADASKKSDKNILPKLGDDSKYKEAIRKGDNFMALKRYADAKKAYEEALTQKGGDPYAKEKLLECEKILQSDANQVTDERQKQLLAKYPSGVTEEIIPMEGVVIIKRVLVKERVAYVYEKKVFNWGGLAFFRDGAPITETTFEQETKK